MKLNATAEIAKPFTAKRTKDGESRLSMGAEFAIEERPRFERWLARYILGTVQEIREQRIAEGGYADIAYDVAWAAWQARAPSRGRTEGRP